MKSPNQIRFVSTPKKVTFTGPKPANLTLATSRVTPTTKTAAKICKNCGS